MSHYDKDSLNMKINHAQPLSTIINHGQSWSTLVKYGQPWSIMVNDGLGKFILGFIIFILGFIVFPWVYNPLGFIIPMVNYGQPLSNVVLGQILSQYENQPW